jgi:hypothetical protein
MNDMTRPEAVEWLKRHGIEGPDVYLLDLVPLIEMMWADGLVQAPELSLFEHFLAGHVDSINALAGANVISLDRARRFAHRFLDSRPDQALLDELCELVPPVRLSSSNAQRNEALRNQIVEWCLDIGAACVTGYPYDERSRFMANEKARFFAILGALAPKSR